MVYTIEWRLKNNDGDLECNYYDTRTKKEAMEFAKRLFDKYGSRLDLLDFKAFETGEDEDDDCDWELQTHFSFIDEKEGRVIWCYKK